MEDDEEIISGQASRIAQEDTDKIIKRIPSLAPFRDELIFQIDINISEIMSKYADRVEQNWKMKIKTNALLREKRNKATALVKKIEKILPGPWIQMMKDELNNIKIDSNKKPPRPLSPLIADLLKKFWIETAGHKKFYYEPDKQYPDVKADDATLFIDTFIEVVFFGNGNILTKEAFREISDKRDKTI